jgi:hypothetical protein
MTSGNDVRKIGEFSFHVAAMALITIFVLTGCDGSKGGQVTKDEQFTQLMQRPDLDQTINQYERVRQEIASQLSQQLSLPPWTRTSGRAGEAGCGREFPDVGLDATISSPENMISAAPVPDEKWDLALGIAGSITAKYGFAAVSRVADAPGNHQAEFHDTYGGRLALGTQVNTILSVRTGCHLTAAAHQRGNPASS